MKRVQIIALILALIGSIAAAFWAAPVKTLTVYPDIDSYSWESVPNANNGGSDNFEITSSINGSKNMRGWIVFNIPSMASDAWVLTATLRLRVWHKTTNDTSQGVGDSTGRIYAVYRVTDPWREYNITWANQPNHTETHYATARVPPGQGGWDGPVLWMEWDLTDMVRDWRSGAPNYGILVRDTQENSRVLYSTQFFTHDPPLPVPHESSYPRLIVTYVNPQALGLLAGLFLAEGFFIIALWRMKLGRSDTSRWK